MFLQRKRRQRLLTQIHDTWLKGVLEPSLADVPPISLPLLTWTVADAQTPFQPLPVASSPLIDIYDTSRHSLVIIGDEGAGKTTVLLELLRDIWQRAEQDTQAPIPVMFHLSSWTTKCQPLEKWLAEEWKVLYSAGEFKAGEFLLILDGFDTIREELQGICFQAINAYQEMYQRLRLVFCCRNTDYEHIQSLVLIRPHNVVQIQPLTDEQIDTYVSQACCDQEAMKRTLEANSDLYVLVHRPLPLAMLSQLYQGSMKPDIAGDDQEELLQNLCAIYIQNQLVSSQRDNTQTGPDTCRRLSWLANRLWQDQITGIHLEQFWPRWLPSRRWVLYYRLLMSLMTFIIGLIMLSDTIPKWDPLFILVWLGIVVVIFLFRRPIDVDADKSFFRGGWLWLALGKMPVPSNLPTSWFWIFQIVSVFILILVTSGIDAMLDEHVFFSHYWIPRALRYATISGFFMFLFVTVYEGISTNGAGIYLGMYQGLFTGIRFWMATGGDAFIEYWIIRFCFWRTGCLPWRYRGFLDAQVERKLLFRIGSSYLFRHQMFLRYFASLHAKASVVAD